VNDLDDLTFLLIAYVVIWLGLFGYMFYLHMKQIKLNMDVEMLEETVKTYAKKERDRDKKRKK
jgi:CcmD family protein